MVRIAMKQRDAKAAIAGVDEERPQTEGRGFGEVFIGIAAPAVDLERDIELAAFLCRLEQEGVAEGAAGKTRVFTALRAEPDGAKGDTKRIGVDRLEPEGRPVGANGFHADGAPPDPGAQRVAYRAKPLAGIVGIVDQALGDRLEPDDLAQG